MKTIILLYVLMVNFAFATDAIRSYTIKSNEKNLALIAKRFEIVSRKEDSFEVYVKVEAEREFLKLAPKAILKSKNIHENILSFSAANGYKKYSDIELSLKKFATDYPELISLESYGVSKNKRPLYALKFKAPNNVSNKTEILVTAATHGDELMPVEVLLKLMEEMFAQYGKDSRMTKMLDDKVIYFIPVVSPDSFESRSRYVEGVDPNRCYPWPLNPKNKPVPVIDSLITFFHQHNFKASMDLHAYGRLIMYPWGYTKKSIESAEDLSIMNDLTSSMAHENEYTYGQISTTIYVAEGSSADYYYWKNKTRALGVEIGDDKIPSIAKLPKYVDESREMIYKFFEYTYL
jgi:hypothetical protein